MIGSGADHDKGRGQNMVTMRKTFIPAPDAASGGVREDMYEAADPRTVLATVVDRCIAEGAPIVTEVPAVEAPAPAVDLEQIIDDEADLEQLVPRNEVTGHDYKGGNIVRLITAQVENGYGPGGWAGYRQWLTVGRVVRKGEHGTACLTVVTVDRDADGNGGTRKPRGFRVFHYDQTTELETGDEVTP